MKTKLFPTTVIISALVFSLGFMACGSARPLTAKEVATRIDSLVSLPKIHFRPNTALPQTGNVVNTLTGFDLYISKDSINSYLPFFGRAYRADYGGGSGIIFISKKFDYKMTKEKSGSYQIRIKPLDTKVRYEMFLTVGNSGYATLNVSNPDTQPISFYGDIDY